MAVHGYVLVDKPVGPSSHATVQRVRRALGMGGRRGGKAGHAGTLDPFASGLLVVLIGRATRLMPYVVGHDKRYVVRVRFGASSTTDDAVGDLTISDAPAPTEAAVRHALTRLAASTTQVPPAVSAIHIDGERAYRRVLRGEEIVVPSRPVRFDSIDVLEWRSAGAAETGPSVVLDVRCASGTYMRALARDLGAAVGCPAHCEDLRRTEIGSWDVADAPDAADLQLSDVRDALDLVPDVRRLRLADEDALLDVARGRAVPIGSIAGTIAEEVIAIVAPDGSLAAMGFVDGDVVRPRTVLVDPAAVGVGGSAS